MVGYLSPTMKVPWFSRSRVVRRAVKCYRTLAVPQSQFRPDSHTARNLLHVIAITDLWCFMFAEVLQDLSDLSSAAQGNRVFAIKLGVVPVHLCESQHFLGDEGRRLIGANNSEFYGLRDVKPCVRPIVLNRPPRIEKVPLLIQLNLRSAVGWILPGLPPFLRTVCLAH